jgi:hypothetical protein
MDGGGINGPVVAIVSPAEDAVSGTITVRAEVIGAGKVDFLNCTLGGTALADSDSTPGVFQAAVDTTPLVDGAMTLNCKAGDGTGTGEASRTITIGNKNPVSFSVYMAEPVADLETVKVLTGTGKLVTILKPDASGKIAAALPPGAYQFEASGGYYISRMLTTARGAATPIVLKLYGSLTGRARITAGKPAEVVITPLTHLREKLLLALQEKGIEDAETRSLRLLSGHYGDAFDIYGKPVSGDSKIQAGMHWLALAAFEQIALDICKAGGLSPESVGAEDILNALSQDLADALLDGKGGTLSVFGFGVDSYFFRYWYAAALMHTGAAFQDVQSLVYTISTDSSELFPAADLPREVVKEPPRMVDLKFKTAPAPDFTVYDRTSGSIPYSNMAAFDLRFRVVPARDQKVLDSGVRISSSEADCGAPRLIDPEKRQYASSCVFNVASKDGEKEISIGATDEIGNVAILDIAAIKDVTPPVVKVGGCPSAPKKSSSPDLKFSVKLTESNPLSLTYKLNGGGESTCSAGTDNLLANTAGLVDGENMVSVTAKDKAGNIGMDSCQIVVDDTPPAAEKSAVARLSPAEGSKATAVSRLEVMVDRDKISDNITANRMIEAFFTVHKSDNQIYTGVVPLMPGNDRFFRIDWDLDPNSKYRYELKLKDEAGNVFTADTAEWYVDLVPPPIAVSGPAGAYSQYYDAVVLMGTGSDEPEGLLYPPFDELARVEWKEIKSGKSGFCTRREPGIFDCHVDLGKNPEAGVHYLYFFGYDTLGNHQTDHSKCGEYNLHCIKYPVTFYTVAPNITGFAVSPDKTGDQILIAWDIENADTTYTCRIGYPTGPKGIFWTKYDCSGDRGGVISLVSKGLDDLHYTVRLTADRTGITATAERYFLLDRAKPVVGDPSLVSQDDASFTVRYDITDLSLSSIDSRLAHRWYFDQSEGVKMEEDTSYALGKNTIVSSELEFAYSKAGLPGGVYKKLSIEACDEVQNCQSGGAEHPFTGDAAVLRETRGIGHQQCTDSACSSLSRTIVGSLVKTKAFKVVPCDACIEDILPKNLEMFVDGTSGRKKLSVFAIFWNAIKLDDPIYGGTFKFPAEFDSMHKYATPSGWVSEPSHFTKADVVPFIQSCRSVPPADYICEYMLSDVTEELLRSTGCINTFESGGTVTTGDFTYCFKYDEQVQRLKAYPDTVAVKYCNSKNQCIIAIGRIPDKITAGFDMSGRHYEHEVF